VNGPLATGVPRTRPPRSPQLWRLGRIALAVAGSVLMLVVSNAVAFDDPGFVERVTVQNPSEYDIRVVVAPSSGSAVLPLGVVGQRCAATFGDVVDQGDSWTVRFEAQGSEGGTATVEREALERNGWVVQVPASVVEHLRQTKVPAPPVHGCAPS
jgi:hypothetical protein